jgi:class 3 adenylate cyclase
LIDPISDKSQPGRRRTSREELGRLLTEITRHPERESEITKIIEETFGQKKTVLVLDMSGFSRTTHLYGIVSFLLMIHQTQLICIPCIEQNRGKVIKADADNLFCVFDTVDSAVGAGREIQQRLNAANLLRPADRHLYAAIGIGYGKILILDDEELFGDEVNLACKLGEDIGDKGAILLTAAARAGLADSSIVTREMTISISGLMLTFYALEG